MANYTFTTETGSTEIALSKDMLQGIYSAQLLAGLEAHMKGGSEIGYVGETDILRNDSKFGDYGFTLTQNRPRDSMVRSYDISLIYPWKSHEVKVYFLSPDDYSIAYSQALQDALVFKPIFATISNTPWDTSKIFYHTVLNYDRSNSAILDMSLFNPTGSKKEIDPDTIFVHDGDDGELSAYYVGTTFDARNTVMVKMGSNSSSVSEWLKGLCLFFKWVFEGKFVTDPLINHPIEKPELYLYIYNKPVALVNAKDRETMESQLPNVIHRLNY